MDAELVEQHPLRKWEIFVAAFFDTEPDQIADQDRIGVVIASDGVGRPLQWPCRRVMEGIDAAGIKVDVIRIRSRWVIIRVLGRLDPKPARHVKYIRNAYFGARVAVRLPFTH